MAAPKKPTHEVVHPKVYIAGKHIERGSPVVLDEKTAAKLGKKVMVHGKKATVDLTSADDSESAASE